jgi:hypothetical protein
LDVTRRVAFVFCTEAWLQDEAMLDGMFEYLKWPELGGRWKLLLGEFEEGQVGS